MPCPPHPPAPLLCSRRDRSRTVARWAVALWALVAVVGQSVVGQSALAQAPARPSQEGPASEAQTEPGGDPEPTAPAPEASSSDGAPPAGKPEETPELQPGDPDEGPVAEAPAEADSEFPDDPALVELPPLPGDDLDAAEGLAIRRIEITGTRRIATEDVRTYLRLKEGEPMKKVTLRRDVRELWRAGFFDDIEVDLRQVSGGVDLRFHVKERPAISAVEFEGNDEIDDDDLAEAIEVKVDTILSRPALRRAVQKIRDMYAEQGYFLAEASSKVVAQRNNEVTVRFTVQEHSQVSVKRITFIGNESVTTDELRKVMFTGNPGILSFGSGGPFRQDAFERDIAMISALYYDRGFLQVVVNTPRVMLTPDKSGIEVSVTIDEGPRFRIRQLRVFEQGPDGKEIDPLPGRRALRLMVRADSGDYFNRAQLLEDLELIRAIYRDEGYANVIAEPQTNIDVDTNEVDLIVPVRRGPLVYFERIEVRGNTKTRDKVIRRQFEIAEGQKFSETGLNRSRRRVTALGFFERVDISTQEGSGPDRLIVYVDVAEKPTGTFQVGAGFSSIENFIATAQVQQANVFGNGQSLSLQGQFSGIRSQGNLRFVEPYFLNSKFSVSVDVFDQLRRYVDFSQRSRGGAFTVGYPLIDPEVNISLTYSATLDEVSTSPGPAFLGGSFSQTSIFAQLPLANLFRNGLTSSVRPAISFDNRDNRLFPTSGIYLNLSSEIAVDATGSENQFIRNRWTGRFYVPMPYGVLKLNTEAGLVTSPSPDGVPIFARFFLGGILDVRGFYFRTLGPRMPLTESTDPNSAPIPNGATIGGNLMYYQNLEYEFPIFESVGLKGVIFTDLGNAWNLEGNYCEAAGRSALYPEVSPCFDAESLLHMRASWGFGFRWFSPMGPLRFEWGFPFSRLPYEEDHRFEFTIGNFF